MANQTLLEFTTKTTVDDADWVFVWDTAGAISKKVSRNSLLNSGTLTTSAPVTISQTWNAVAQTFKALVVNAAGSSAANSASGSLLLDLQVGGVSQFRVNKAGTAFMTNLAPSGFLSFQNDSGQIYFGAGGDVVINRDGAGQLALRNSTAAQTFNVYGTYTSGTSYERLTLSAPSAANAIIGTNKGSGGGTARGLEFQTDGVSRWTISTAGHLLAATDNTYDIGASGANRPRTIYAGSGINAGSGSNSILSIASAIAFNLTGGVYGGTTQFALFAPSDGVLRLTNGATTDFNRMQLGGTIDAFPAIARDGAGIKFTGAAAGLTSHIKVPAVAVTSLPAAATAGVGARAFVNDALSPVFGNTVATGGAVAVPVYSDGSAWKVG